MRTEPDERVLVPIGSDGRVMTGPNAHVLVSIDDGDARLMIRPDARVFVLLDSDRRVITGPDARVSGPIHDGGERADTRHLCLCLTTVVMNGRRRRFGVDSGGLRCPAAGHQQQGGHP